VNIEVPSEFQPKWSGIHIWLILLYIVVSILKCEKISLKFIIDIFRGMELLKTLKKEFPND